MTKEQLLLEIERSRNSLARDFASAKLELDPRHKVMTSIRAKPLVWISAATALGWMLAGPKSKTRVLHKSGKKSIVKEKATPPIGIFGIVLAILKLSLPMLKPAFSAYAAKRFAEMASKLAS